MKPVSSLPVLLLGLCFALGACVATERTLQPIAAAAGLTSQISDRLYLGRSIPAGGTVSDQAWAAFLAGVVTPRFPRGFTVWPAEGQWKETSGTITRESSCVLELIHPVDAATDRAVREIADDYKRRLSQEAVLLVRTLVEAGF